MYCNIKFDTFGSLNWVLDFGDFYLILNKNLMIGKIEWTVEGVEVELREEKK